MYCQSSHKQSFGEKKGSVIVIGLWKKKNVARTFEPLWFSVERAEHQNTNTINVCVKATI